MKILNSKKKIFTVQKVYIYCHVNILNKENSYIKGFLELQNICLTSNFLFRDRLEKEKERSIYFIIELVELFVVIIIDRCNNKKVI